MPDITSSGTVDKSTAGFDLLGAQSYPRALLFAGSSLGSSCTLRYIDDQNTSRECDVLGDGEGAITVLPTMLEVKIDADLEIVTTGSPNFNLTIKRIYV